eukprot:jgi/Picre1/28160/NNA_003566.t1
MTTSFCQRGILSRSHDPVPHPAWTTRATTTPKQRRSTHVVKSGLDASSSYAIAQQAIAFAIVSGAEAAYTGKMNEDKPETPGLPTLTSTLIGIGATVVSAIVIKSDPGIAPVGCITGLISSGYILYTNINRVRDTPYNPEEWPGAKTSPAVCTLLTFFLLMAYIQGLRASFGI